MASETAPKPTACLALADGTLFYGYGFGATGKTVAELCFNTAMTGYQEIMTDPSYAGQIVTFTFPHIGNTGMTDKDDETADPVAEGMVVKWDPTEPSNWQQGPKQDRSNQDIKWQCDQNKGCHDKACKSAMWQRTEWPQIQLFGCLTIWFLCPLVRHLATLFS